MKQQAEAKYISQENQAYSVADSSVPNKGHSRIRLFVVSFIVSLIIGLVINYSRPAVYQSSATLLTSAATDVDQRSREVDLQHVTIQKKKLLDSELLTETLAKIKHLEHSSDLSTLTLVDIRNMLKVEPIEETNLLNMSAQGPNAEILPVVINSWVDVYLGLRAQSVTNAANDTVQRVKDELVELDTNIEKTRKEIDVFRKEHDISSISREENELPATLISLTEAFNDASQEVLQSKAKLDAINQAIANGQAVVPKFEQTSLSELEKEYRELTAQLAEFDKNFTRDYLQYKATMKHIPEQIKKLKQQIKQKREIGKGIVWTEANQAYFAAKQVVEKIRLQLDEHKTNASNFTTLFSKHQKLMDDLESMEIIARETQDRLLKLESKQFEKYPQVDVVNRASVNSQAISPDYMLGLLIALITALFLAFFTVWFRGYLLKDSEGEVQSSFDFPLASMLGQTPQYDAITSEPDHRIIEQKNQNGLPQIPRYQKITDSDIQLLLTHADNNTQQLILLLMSGLNLEEIQGLNFEQMSSEPAVIHLSGKLQRTVPVGQVLQGRLDLALHNDTLWDQHLTLSLEEMQAMLYCSAVDFGLTYLDSTLAETLRQSYIIYLVEQGLRLTSLAEVVGYLSPVELAGYAVFSPAGGGINVDQVQLIHPVCNNS